MALINVLVVDDSAFMRRIISDMINSSEKMKVIDTARNGIEAIEKIKKLNPDVVTLDIEMPIMDGLTALNRIMETFPLPVLMLSSLTNEGADATIKALDLGAIDFITKPTSIFKINVDDLKEEIINKIIIASKANSKTKYISKPQSYAYKKTENKLKTNTLKKIVAIGTSTGGPKALQTLLPSIHKNIDAAFVIVQHMPPGFTKSLANRLNSISQINVKEAENNDILLPGNAYIAPGDYHMTIIKAGDNYKIVLNQNKPVNGHRPSVDVLMNSIASEGANNVIGVILTGMGSDGALGLKEVKNNSAYVIAQEEESCVVYGMPKSAVNLGIVDKILPIEEISNEIIKVVEV